MKRNEEKKWSINAATIKDFMPYVAILFAAVLCSLQYLYNGPGVSPDSVEYFSAASSFVESGSMRNLSGEYYSYWPPLYPFFLSLLHVFGISLLSSGIIINIASCALIAFIFTKWVLRTINNSAVAGVAIFMGAGSPNLLYIAGYAWSETLYTALAIASLYCISSFYNNRNLIFFSTAAFLTALAILTRYVGITLLGSQALFIVIIHHKYLLKAIKLTVLFVLPSFLALSFWMVRTYVLTGTLTGDRNIPDSGLFDNSVQMGRVVMDLFLPSLNFTSAVYLIFVSIVLAFMIIGIICFLIRYIRFNEPRDLYLLFLGVYSLIYICFITIIASITVVDIDTRMFSPVSLIFLLFVLVIFEYLINFKKNRSTNQWFKNVLILLLLLWMVFWPIHKSISKTISRIDKGAGGYNKKIWIEDVFLSNLKKNPPKLPIISNDPYGLKFVAGINSELSPRKTMYRSTEDATRELDVLLKKVESDNDVARF